MANLLVIPVMLPLIAAVATLLWQRGNTPIGLLALVATTVSALVMVWHVAGSGPLTLELGGWQAGLGIALYADSVAVVLLTMTATVALAAGVSACGYFKAREDVARFWPLWLLLISALNALYLSGDLFNLYVTLELLGLSAVALTALGRQRESVQAALRYLVIGLLGSLLFLAGVVVVYASYGTLDMATLRTAVGADAAAWVALGLLTAGLLIKSALFPMHFWLPPAHANAPAPVSAALSALVVKAAFYLLLRLWVDVMHPAVTPGAAWLLGLLGAIAILWGGWQALMAERLKTLAAYSTVSQLGYLFAFLPVLLLLPDPAAQQAVLGAVVLMALTHGFAKSALFIAAGSVYQSMGHDRITGLGGMVRALPVTTFTIALAGVALIGLPPSGAFLAKWQLLSASMTLQQWLWIAVIAAGSLLAAGYVFRVLAYAFSVADGVETRRIDRRAELPAMLLAIIATAVLGLGSAWIWGFVTLPSTVVAEVAT